VPVHTSLNVMNIIMCLKKIWPHGPETCLGCHKDIQHFIDEKQLYEYCYAVSQFEFPPNICTACNKGIPDIYYNYKHQMCRCCYAVSLGQDKRCASCGELKHITLFGRPYLFTCRKCVNARFRMKRHCDIRNYDVTVGGWSNHC
jgi:hypothetical protein